MACNLFPGKISCLKIINWQAEPSDVFYNQSSTSFDQHTPVHKLFKKRSPKQKQIHNLITFLIKNVINF